MKATRQKNPENGAPEQAHARERFWQILFPMLLVGALLAAGFVLLLLYSGELGTSTEGMAAAALVAMALPLIFVFLVTFILAVALIAAAAKVAAWLPGVGKEALDLFRSIGTAAQNGSCALLAPLMAVAQKLAELQRLISALRSGLIK
ncbi:MAG: hypothetical protein GX415_06115 [Chloroflexi bacterium]|nr:hypothetical protein [Chloroflexota bacterium]HOT26325.1 hypothetical protein [Anaerolineaceae bacterium]HQL27935.1 hypothetical protein [Anaerolineaceae bacterium]